MGKKLDDDQIEIDKFTENFEKYSEMLGSHELMKNIVPLVVSALNGDEFAASELKKLMKSFEQLRISFENVVKYIDDNFEEVNKEE